MRILIIDATRDRLFVAIADGELAVKSVKGEGKKHLAALMPAIDGLLKEQSLALADIDILAAVNGPGSFTGIRIGIATANAIANALGKKLIDVNYLDIAAHGIKDTEFCAAIFGGHDYYAVRVKDGGREYCIMTEAELSALAVPVYKRNEDSDYFDSILSLVRERAGRGEFVAELRPNYFKPSQAERLTEQL